MTEQGATVDVVMTEAATHFITPVTMQALSGRPVFVDAWDARVPNNMAHIDLTRGADAVLIAPASADFMAKLAHGMADDLLSTLCLARACPLLVAPAMNREMWANPATQRNVEQLRADGIAVLGPAAGEQACGETGDGRMLEAHELLTDLIAFFQPKLLAGRHVLLTAGPTSEPVDPIRVLSNRSSGKTGYALARAREAGARVTLVTGATALPVPRGVTSLSVTTARQMHDAVMASAMDADIFIAVAAVADWRVKNVSAQKLKKTSEGGGAPQMEFRQSGHPRRSGQAARRPLVRGLCRRDRKAGRARRGQARAQGHPAAGGQPGAESHGRGHHRAGAVRCAGRASPARSRQAGRRAALIAEIAARLPD